MAAWPAIRSLSEGQAGAKALETQVGVIANRSYRLGPPMRFGVSHYLNLAGTRDQPAHMTSPGPHDITRPT